VLSCRPLRIAVSLPFGTPVRVNKAAVTVILFAFRR